jgi:hypothetical protein
MSLQFFFNAKISKNPLNAKNSNVMLITLIAIPFYTLWLQNIPFQVKLSLGELVTALVGSLQLRRLAQCISLFFALISYT